MTVQSRPTASETASGTPEPVPFFGIARENTALEAELLPEISRILRAGEMVNNADVRAFEAGVAETAGRAHAIATTSGTDALAFALMALGIGPGDEVIVPDFTFIASASAILRTGARPVFADIGMGEAEREEAPCTLDLSDAERRLTPATRAMVWVGLFGGMGDPAPVEDFARRHGLLLVMPRRTSAPPGGTALPGGWGISPASASTGSRCSPRSAPEGLSSPMTGRSQRGSARCAITGCTRGNPACSASIRRCPPSPPRR